MSSTACLFIAVELVGIVVHDQHPDLGMFLVGFALGVLSWRAYGWSARSPEEP